MAVIDIVGGYNLPSPIKNVMVRPLDAIRSYNFYVIKQFGFICFNHAVLFFPRLHPILRFDLRVGQIVKSSSIVSKMPAREKKDQLHFLDLKTCNPASNLKCLFYNYARERLKICNFGLLDD